MTRRTHGPTRRVLVVAYYFPPMGLSGVQRVAKLVKYLPRHGWKPEVLTVRPAGYFAFDDALLREVEAAGVPIHRTASLDPTRLFGGSKTVALPDERRRRRLSRLSQMVFVPDNKIGWLPFAVSEGRRLLRTRRFDAVLSSAPPYTAHLAAAWLARSMRLPLVLDYRDDWVGNPRHEYATPAHRWINERLERAVHRRAAHVLTINPYIADALRSRMPRGGPDVSIVPQGFDADDFSGPPPPRMDGRFRLVYSGVFYDAQTPDVFLLGLARFLDAVPAARSVVEALFVGLFPDASRALIDELGLAEVVRTPGYLSHGEAVGALRTADVLWMTVGARPGAEGISTSKLFEYMGARKPILALVPPGAARDALEPYGAATVVAPDDADAVAGAIGRLYEAWREGAPPVADGAYVDRFDRDALAGVVADRLAAAVERK